jgi:hypothetical protein
MPRHVRVAWLALLVSYAAQVLVGWSAAVAIRSPLWGWHQEPLAAALWGGPFPAVVEPYRTLTMGMLGATMASAAAPMCLVLWVPFRRREQWAWWAVLLSMAVWYPVDTAVSVACSVWVNVALNTVVLVSVLVPLAVCWPWFQAAPEAGEPWTSAR